MSNVFAQYYINDNVQIFTYNHPLPPTVESQLENLTSGPTAFNLALLTIFGLGFMMAGFAVFVTAVCVRVKVCFDIEQERVSKAKHIQFVSGVKSWVFWGAYFAWDMIVVAFAAVLVIIVVAIIDVPGESFPMIFSSD